jgi:hypothetical protein
MELYADANAGGFAQPVRDAIDRGIVDFEQR